MTPVHVLTIAGSDPSGGAGIQADLKTFSALGAYGCAVLTSLTAQSTRGVTGIHPVPAAFVREQVETLVDDVRLDAVKIGMLGTAEVVEVVADLVRDVLRCPVVLDPVMVSTAGSRLLDRDAVEAMRSLAQLADAVTPNLAEAAVLLGRDELDPTGAVTVESMHEQTRALRGLGVPRVLLKGGHGGGPESVDLWAEGDAVHELHAPRIDTANTHGTGCTLSSAVAALVPQRGTWLESVTAAKAYLTGTVEHADELSVGHGPGPVHHFWERWG